MLRSNHSRLSNALKKSLTPKMKSSPVSQFISFTSLFSSRVVEHIARVMLRGSQHPTYFPRTPRTTTGSPRDQCD